jgi:hypothetical protein
MYATLVSKQMIGHSHGHPPSDASLSPLPRTREKERERERERFYGQSRGINLEGQI